MKPRHAAPRRTEPGRKKLWGAAGAAVVVVAAAVVILVGPAPPSTRSTAGSDPKTSSVHQAPAHRRKKGKPATHRRTSTHHRKKTEPATFEGPDGVEARWVIEENEKPGTTAWKITGTQTPTGIMGYASRVEARKGQTVHLYVSTKAPTFHVDAYRMGYYQGKGGRLIWRSPEVTGVVQPSCPVTPGINMVQCSWTSSLSFPVTSAWVQGEYLLKLVGSGNQQAYVPLTIWDPSSHATYVVMEGVLTQQVFNPFGGYDLYQGATPCAPGHYPCSTRSRIVSFDRPYAYSYGQGAGTFLSLVYPLTRFMEKHGLNVTYWTDITLAQHGNLLENHTTLISTGHDEEWSLRMRNAAVAGRDHGVNLIFFGASPVLRKVRLQASPIGADMQIVNYRNPTADPMLATDPAEVSQNWWGQPPADLPASTLVGSSYIGFNNTASFPLVASDPTSWLFAGTGLAAGAEIPDVLTTDFQEYNPTRADTPANVEILAHSPVTVTLHPGPHYADTTYYTMPGGGAGVFESGANSWIPALAACPATGTTCPAPMLRRLTANVLRVFGTGPVGRTEPSVANWQDYYG